MTPSRDLSRLIEIMAALRDPATGCPWDVKQDFGTVAPYTIEEAYEVAEAIARGDMEDLRDELGDLLLQVVFHARMAEERGAFDFGDVCHAITDKLVRRHPHVFGDRTVRDGATVKANWEAIKAEEKRERARRRGEEGGGPPPSLLDDVPLALPALARAEKLQKRAARVGFHWEDSRAVADKIREESAELDEAVASGDRAKVAEEVGDLLFAVANLARHHDVDPEAALRAANGKFMRRFRHIENAARESGTEPRDAGLERMEMWWAEAKAAERAR